MKIHNIPKLEATSKSKPEDLAKFFVWKAMMEVLMKGLDLWDTISRKQEQIPVVEKPKREQPTREEMLNARNEQDYVKLRRLINLHKKWKEFKEYEEKISKMDSNEKKAMYVLVQSLGEYPVIKFKVHYSEDKANEFWERITKYFLQDSALIINNNENGTQISENGGK